MGPGEYDAVTDENGDVGGLGGFEDAFLEFGAPELRAGLRIDGANVAVAADIESLIHVRNLNEWQRRGRLYFVRKFGRAEAICG